MLKLTINFDGDVIDYACDLGGILDGMLGDSRFNTHIVTTEGDVLTHGQYVTDETAKPLSGSCTLEVSGNTELYEILKELVAYHEGGGFGCMKS